MADVATLSCARCSKPANLQCPKCVELKLPREAAAFCTQDCFKASWSSHKSVHVKAKQSDGTGSAENEGWLYCMKKGQNRSPKLPYFEWTGYVSIKTPDQIERMRETCRIAREVLDAAARVIQPGITTDEIDRVVHDATIAAVYIHTRGMDNMGITRNLFHKMSVNEVICHGIPDARKLEDGDIVNVDISVYYKGVHADLNDTYFVGNVDEESQRLVQCTYECLEKAIAIAKPGVRFREVGDVINRHATMAGFSVVKSYCGHGIGELFHCAPDIPHYARNKAVGVMKAGQTFTIEPMINAGDRDWS
uniref:methionine aminopeptidase 1A n=1 Tax=Fragaria vesca subsp. vesca TaxID=101020 RepID=UPI0005C8FB5B|nr:PREDICTED: methionine aminopeptidase 1A [Fragaria vesca subsp. vesca]